MTAATPTPPASPPTNPATTATTSANAPQDQAMQLIVISGMSGSGKSVALHALEDAGFYCVDNLPPELLLPLVEVERQHNSWRLAIAVDVRSAQSLAIVPVQLTALRNIGVHVRALFFDASDDTLIRRYSETRRKHPLTEIAGDNHTRDLKHAIAHERELLAHLRATSHVIDTSMRRASGLRSHMRELVTLPYQPLTLVFESFAFKRGIPNDADFVFDVRMLPNPHYEPELRPLTGRDAAVADYLAQRPEVHRMVEHIQQFLHTWLPSLAQDHRSYVTVGIGCTGGQHRSVYITEQLARTFAHQWPTLHRHRELD